MCVRLWQEPAPLGVLLPGSRSIRIHLCGYTSLFWSALCFSVGRWELGKGEISVSIRTVSQVFLAAGRECRATAEQRARETTIARGFWLHQVRLTRLRAALFSRLWHLLSLELWVTVHTSSACTGINIYCKIHEVALLKLLPRYLIWQAFLVIFGDWHSQLTTIQFCLASYICRLQFSKIYFIPHDRGQNEEPGLINFYRELSNVQYFSQTFYPFFLLWQDNLRLLLIICKSHQLSGENSWKAQQHHLFCANPNLFPEGLNIFFGRSALVIVQFCSLLSCPSSLPFGRLSDIIKKMVVM